MATITFQWSGDGVARMTAALETLAGPRREAAVRRALNHVGDKAFTRVRRALAQQMGLPSQRVFKDGRTLTKQRAAGGSLSYAIVSRGKAIRAKEFRHSVGKKGITFYPWNRRLSVKSAFVIKRYGGNFYRRRTPKRFPLEALYGPNLNKELVKDASAAAWRAVIAEVPPRLEHEIRYITGGVFS